MSTAQLCSATSKLSNHRFDIVHTRPATTPFKGGCSFSTNAGAKTSGEATSGSVHEGSLNGHGDLVRGELVFESSPSFYDSETPRSQTKKDASEILEDFLAASPRSMSSAMDTWIEGGNKLTRSIIIVAMHGLRKRRLYARALELSEWLESSKNFNFTEKDYVTRCDLIAKVRGLDVAKSYIQQIIPESLRNEEVYATLLANCVAAEDLFRSEDVFHEMKALELPLTRSTFNQMLLIYAKITKRKVYDFVRLMEKRGMKLDLFSYRMLIDAMGHCG